jgi:cobalt-zinc-cadmium resistance protein CzcA
MKTKTYKKAWRAVIIVLLCIAALPFSSSAQEQRLTLEDCIRIALANNLQVKTATLEVQQSRVLQGTAFDLPKTNLNATQDPTSGGNIDNSIGISQSISLPVVYATQKKALQQQTRLSEKSRTITQAEIARSVKQAYYSLLFAQDKIKVYDYLEGIYSDFNRKAEVRLKTGETSNLEMLTARAKYQELQLSRKEVQADFLINQSRLQQLLNADLPVKVAGDTLQPLEMKNLPDTAFNQNPQVQYYNQSRDLATARIKAERSTLLPELTFGYNHQLVVKGFNPAKINRDYMYGTRIAGLQVGVSVPLIRSAYNSRIKAEKLGESIAQSRINETQRRLQAEWNQGYQSYLKYKQSLDYYQLSGLQLSNEQIRVAQFAFSKGEIGYVEFIQNIATATQSKLTYLSTVYSLNEAVIHLQFLQGEAYAQ